LLRVNPNITERFSINRMGLLSFLRKNKQESRSDSTFQSRAEEDTDAVRNRGKRKTGKERGRAPDPVLPEKKRARRRLVGAVALVMAAVVGLPMILDSEPKPVTDDIAIDIPSKDKRTQSGAVRTAPPPVANVARPPVGLDKDEEVIDPASLPPPAETGPSTAARSEMPQLVKPEPRPRPELRAETRLEPKSEHKAETPRPAKTESKAERKTELAHAKPAEKADEAGRARAILEGRPEPKAEARAEPKKESGRFVVQVAALATQDKVDELQGKLKSAGIASFTQKVSTDSGSRTRIRVGPFSSKEEADRVRAKLSKIGLAGTLVPT
jgi:DedD protein